MQNAGDVAALVAAFFFAAGVCAGVYVLVRLARMISEGTRLLADMRSRSDTAFEQVQAAVDRANRQLDATSSVTAGMDELNEGMSQLTDQVSALAGLGRAISAGPAGRVGAFVYGVRHAVAIRRDGTGRPERTVGLDHSEQLKAISGGRRSPAQSGGRRSPAQSGGYRSPAQSGGYRSPAQSGGRRSPAQSGGYRSPAQSGGPQ